MISVQISAKNEIRRNYNKETVYEGRDSAVSVSDIKFQPVNIASHFYLFLTTPKYFCYFRFTMISIVMVSFC